MNLSTNLRELRDRLGLSQEELARRCACDRKTISNIEHGLHEPRVLLALCLARQLGVELALSSPGNLFPIR